MHTFDAPELKQKAELLDEVPGIGLMTAVTLVAEVPELGT
ncbi:MAG: transposase [Roseiflexus sp.]|jgi:5,10-methylene-tetrahydrofolate dehydrogenase/methenyl tetrahydrofolate cyclohydrolase|nr:transposase [Roseiflexus sp.]MBO9336753.1 transposase [Roseiflexus sp.]MBO9383471.1 transposase [Roseiflexus sp.]MBO9388451.1 transposase [Roseiflexus sp.]